LILSSAAEVGSRRTAPTRSMAPPIGVPPANDWPAPPRWRARSVPSKGRRWQAATSTRRTGPLHHRDGACPRRTGADPTHQRGARARRNAAQKRLRWRCQMGRQRAPAGNRPR